jgi:cell division protein FtsL
MSKKEENVYYSKSINIDYECYNGLRLAGQLTKINAQISKINKECKNLNRLIVQLSQATTINFFHWLGKLYQITK